MTPDELVTSYPVLHHMADLGAWPKIRRIGLRTTEQLLDACGADEPTRDAVLRHPRTRSVELTHPVVGAVTIRDQKPLRLRHLEPKLVDVTVEEFLALLSDRVFLWAHPARLARLLAARSYRDVEHDVLVLDTAGIVAAYSDHLRLTTMNTGATIFPNASPRGSASFMRLEDLPFAARRKPLVDNVVEVCVVGGVDHLDDHVIRVERRRGADITQVLYER